MKSVIEKKEKKTIIATQGHTDSILDRLASQARNRRIYSFSGYLKRQREMEGRAKRHRDRDTDRYNARDRQTERQTEIERQRGGEAERQRDIETES